MKKGDWLWLAALVGISSILLVPASHQVFISLTKAHPYLMGFIKFLILATMGELLTIRIVGGDWKTPPGLLWRALIWGLIGMLIVLMFEIFLSGVAGAVAKDMLWTGDGTAQAIWSAFYISAIMNLTFAPTFMAAHRITDTYLDLRCGEGLSWSQVTMARVVEKIDWKGFVTFVVGKTVPFFWIPAHTVTFLLPPEYRILVAAYLSIALGVLLSYAKRRKLRSVNGG